MKKSQRKSFNNVECFKCHNYGHVAANCRSRSFQPQTNKSYIERYSGFFRGYCFSCNMYGHKAVDCKRRKIRNTHAYFSGHMRCYSCNEYGHVEKECRLNRSEKVDIFQHTIRKVKQVWKKMEGWNKNQSREEKDTFVDALEDNDFLEENTQFKDRSET